MSAPSNIRDWHRTFQQLGEQEQRGDLSNGGGSGTYNDMERVWEKLREHDKRFEQINAGLADVAKELSNAKFWFVGTTVGIVLAGLGLVYTARQDTTATMSTALTATQTVISARPTETSQPAPQQPNIIVVPIPSGPAPTSPPLQSPAPAIPPRP